MFALMFLIVMINSDNLRRRGMKAMKDFARALLTSTTQNKNQKLFVEVPATVRNFNPPAHQANNNSLVFECTDVWIIVNGC